jgi:hypothetical protein
MARAPFVRWIVLTSLVACSPRAQPSPPDLDATSRAPGPTPCEGHPYAMRVSGVVRTPEGAPVVGAPIGLAAPWSTPRTLTRSRPDGSYDLELDGPTMLAIQGYPALPTALCAAIPKRLAVEVPTGARVQMNVGGMDFLAAPTCRFELELALEADAKPTAPTAPLEVSAWVDGARIHHDALPLPEDLILALPCHAQGVSIVGGGLSLVGAPEGPSCGLPAGVTCLPGLKPDGRHKVDLKIRAADEHEIVVRGPDGAPQTGAAVRTAWGEVLTDAQGRARVTLPDAAFPITIEAAGHLPARADAHSGRPTEVTLALRRDVEVRCAGAPGDRCPGRVSVETLDGEAVCEPRGDVHVCPAPAGATTWVRHGDARVIAPPELAAVWADYRAIGGAIEGRWASADGPLFAVRAPDGALARWATALGLAAPSTRFARATPARDGTFRLAPLSPGAWTVYAPGSRAAPVTVEVGDGPVAWPD